MNIISLTNVSTRLITNLFSPPLISSHPTCLLSPCPHLLSLFSSPPSFILSFPPFFLVCYVFFLLIFFFSSLLSFPLLDSLSYLLSLFSSHFPPFFSPLLCSPSPSSSSPFFLVSYLSFLLIFIFSSVLFSFPLLVLLFTSCDE